MGHRTPEDAAVAPPSPPATVPKQEAVVPMPASWRLALGLVVLGLAVFAITMLAPPSACAARRFAAWRASSA